MALLFDRRRFGVALCDDESPQVGAIFTRHFLPCRLALVCAEVHLALGFCRSEKDAPPIVGHLDVAEMRPALGFDTDRGAEINVGAARAFGPHIAPPVEEAGLPVLQRALQRLVGGEIHVVRDLLVVVDAHRVVLGR